jgi:hypothetical protein
MADLERAETAHERWHLQQLRSEPGGGTDLEQLLGGRVA